VQAGLSGPEKLTLDGLIRFNVQHHYLPNTALPLSGDFLESARVKMWRGDEGGGRGGGVASMYHTSFLHHPKLRFAECFVLLRRVKTCMDNDFDRQS